MPSLLDRVIGLADEPTDDDDLRLRKRVGVIAGYILVIGPLQLPILAQGLPLSWFVAATMPLVSASNLFLLARTRRFDRYVKVLVVMVLIFPAVIEISLGGLGGASAALVFAFLGPVFALLALGPRRATAWFVAFLVVVAGVILVDPFISSQIAPQPYPIRLVWYAANLAVPLSITFAMLRYTDLRRRRAEARSEELLTNAIPASIAARLKRGEDHIAETYPETTVLFADLVGFTPWARETDPARVVGFLDELFTRFDDARRRMPGREDQDDRRRLHGRRRRAGAARRACLRRGLARARHADGPGGAARAARGNPGTTHRRRQRAGGGRRHR